MRWMLIPPPQLGTSSWLVVDSVLMVLMSSFVEGEFGAKTMIKAHLGIIECEWYLF